MVAPVSTVTPGPEDHVWLDPRASRPMTVSIREIDGVRGDQGYSILQRGRTGSGLEYLLCGGQISAGVYAKCLILRAGHSCRRQATRAGDADDVGQVVFAAFIVVGHLGKQVGQQ